VIYSINIKERSRNRPRCAVSNETHLNASVLRLKR